MSRSKARRKTKDLAPAPPPPKQAFLSKPLIPEVLISLFLITATLAVFWPVKNFDFLTLDDEEYVTENPHVQAGLTAKGVLWAFTTMHASNWHPLTWLSHMLDGVLYGLSPGRPSFDQFTVSYHQYPIAFLAIQADDRRTLEEWFGGSPVCSSSSSCRIGGLGFGA